MNTMMAINEFKALVKTADPDGVVRRKSCRVIGAAIVDGETQWLVALNDNSKIWPELVSNVEPFADDYYIIDPTD